MQIYENLFLKIMQIYKIIFSFTYFFSILIYIFYGRGLRGRSRCRQTEVQTDKQTISVSYAKELANRLSLGPMPRIGEQSRFYTTPR